MLKGKYLLLSLTDVLDYDWAESDQFLIYYYIFKWH